MTALIDNLIAGLTGLVIVFLAGYGPARWLLPRALRVWFWISIPVVGLCVVAVGLGWLSIFFPIRTAAPVLLVLAVVSTIGVRRAPPIGTQRWREQGAIGAFALIGLLVALAPLWGRPDLISIGPNWDTEIYLPMAEYLKESATGFSLTEPAGFPFPGGPNPLLWRVNFFDPRWSGLAFSQIHAAVGVLGGQDAYTGLPGVLALMHALSIPAAFLLFRAGFRLPAGASLAASGLLAVNPAALHVVFWSFGQQAVSLALLPWALATGVAAILEPTRRSAVLAGLALAALMASFIPALPLYAIAMALLMLLVRWRPVLLIAAVSLALAPWAYLRGGWRAKHFLGDQGVAGLTTGPDVAQFPPLGWALGLFPTPEHGLVGMTDSDLIALLVRVLLLAAIGFALFRAARTRNYPLLVCGVGGVGLLLAMRYLAPYPYGYLKLMAGSAFLLVGLLVAGLWMAPRLRTLVAAPVVAAVVSLIQLVPHTGEQSRMAYRDLAGLEATVPPDSSVLVSGHADYQGPPSGALAYFLREAQLYGYIATGFSSFYRVREDGVYDFALYHEREAVPRELYGNAEPVWQGSGLRLYRRPAGAAFVREFGGIQPPIVERTAGQGSASGLRITEWTEEGYPVFRGWSPPGMGVLAETTLVEGRYPEVGEPFRLALPLLTVASRQPPRHDGVVTLGAFHPQEITVEVNGEVRSLSVRPGVGTYPLGAVDLPASLEIRNAIEAPVYLKSVAVYREGSAATTNEDAPLVRWSAQQAGRAVSIWLDYLGPPYRAAFDVYRSDGAHFGDWLLAGSRESGDWFRQLSFEPEVGGLQVLPRSVGDVQVRRARPASPEDGAYRSMLALWDGDRLVRTITLFEFELLGGRLTEVKEGGKRVFIG